MKVVLVDDQAIIREGIISILSLHDTIEVAGEAINKQEALLLIKKEKPDLTIVDFHLGKEWGLDLIKEAKTLGLMCKFAILTYSKELAFFEQAKAMNIDGYISLEAHPEELLYALRMIQKGRKYYDPDIIDLFMLKQMRASIDTIHLQQLTSKEREVLQKLGMGYSNKKIAAMLFITENTVKKHVGQILSKLNLDDRTQAALFANETGVVQYSYAAERQPAL